MKSTLRQPLFLFGLAIKFVALFFFASKYPSEYFIPFLDKAVQNIGQNPWTISHPSLFPYGGVLFCILIVPKFIVYSIFGDGGLGVNPMSLFAFKLPILLIDILLLGVLGRFAGGRRKNLLWLYWLNPAFFYINYILGQVDIASTALVLASIYMLINRRATWSGIFLGMATACKFHVVIIAPVLLIYVWNNYYRPESFQKIAKLASAWLAVALIGFLPLIFSGHADYASLGSPEVQRIFAARLDLGDQTYLYFSVLVVALVLGRIIISTRITELGLIFSAGSLFTAILLTSPAATGWYLWALPFFALFYALYLNINSLLFWSLMLLMLIVRPLQDYAVFAEWQSSPLGNTIWNIMYACLQASLFANLVAIWIVSLKKEAPAINRALPICIGLAGDSGSGKNSTTVLLTQLFGNKNVSMIEGDNYHKWERGDENWKSYTHLNPFANRLLALSDHTKAVLGGRSFESSAYDHGTGTFTEPLEVKPSKVVLIQGLHSFFLREMRDLFDLKIFLAPDLRVRTAWKIRRDCLERGYDKAKVMSQLTARSDDSKLFIDSQRDHADLIFEFFPTSEFTEQDASEGKIPELGLKVTAWNNFDLNQLSAELAKCGIVNELGFSEKTVDRIYLSLKSPPDLKSIQIISERLFRSLRHITRSSVPPQFVAGYDGLIQILTIWILDHKVNQAFPGKAVT